MRSVLEEKLKLDGVVFDELVLKDNVGNLLRGRFRALRGQVGYKLPALLESRARAPVEPRRSSSGTTPRRTPSSTRSTRTWSPDAWTSGC